MRNLRDYLWAESPAEALRLLQTRSGRGAFLGGGTELAATADPHLDFVVDLSRAGLDALTTTPSGSHLGATLPLQTLVEEPRVRALGGGLLAEAARRTRSEPWRRQATLAGRLLEGDPGDLLAPCLAVLGARLVLLATPGAPPSALDLLPGLAQVNRAGRARRTNGASVLPALVLELIVPEAASDWGFALEVLARSALDTPLAVVAVGVQAAGDRISACRIATAGLPAPRRAPLAEAAVLRSSGGDFAAVLAAFAGDLEPVDDWRASAAYRRESAAVLLGRGLRRAVTAARTGS